MFYSALSYSTILLTLSQRHKSANNWPILAACNQRGPFRDCFKGGVSLEHILVQEGNLGVKNGCVPLKGRVLVLKGCVLILKWHSFRNVLFPGRKCFFAGFAFRWACSYRRKKKKKGGVEAAFCVLTPEYRKPRSVGKVTYWPISKTFGRKKKMHLLLDGGIFSAPSAMLLKWHPAAMLLSRRR